MEACKSSLRAKVEQVFFYVKQMFGYGKVRYRSLAKTERLERQSLVFTQPACCLLSTGTGLLVQGSRTPES